jgi:ribosome-binding protein aMBF1 (putative translation factor)
MRLYNTAIFLINILILNANSKYSKMSIDSQSLQKNFGANLRNIRMAKGLTLRALAANCNLDDSNISKIEQGKLDVRLSTVFELAKGLGVEAKDLFNF